MSDNKDFTKAQEIKLMIIQNFIDYLVHDDSDEKTRLYEIASLYVEEDHVDEIIQAGFVEPVSEVAKSKEENNSEDSPIIKCSKQIIEWSKENSSGMIMNGSSVRSAIVETWEASVSFKKITRELIDDIISDNESDIGFLVKTSDFVSALEMFEICKVEK
jgi:hypothetical protein